MSKETIAQSDPLNIRKHLHNFMTMDYLLVCNNPASWDWLIRGLEAHQHIQIYVSTAIPPGVPVSHLDYNHN